MIFDHVLTLFGKLLTLVSALTPSTCIIHLMLSTPKIWINMKCVRNKTGISCPDVYTLFDAFFLQWKRKLQVLFNTVKKKSQQFKNFSVPLYLEALSEIPSNGFWVSKKKINILKRYVSCQYRNCSNLKRGKK